MAVIGKIASGLQAASATFTVEALGNDLQPKIEAALIKHGKTDRRQSKLTAILTVWFTLMMTLRRELSYPNLLAWLVSGLRALGWSVCRKEVSEGAISHARERIGAGVMREVFEASRDIAVGSKPDFHGFLTLAGDGTGMTMPDTPENRERFGKPGTDRGTPAFPQIRVVALVAVAIQAVFEVAFAPYRGKGTGEIALMKDLVLKHAAATILFLLDRGFCGFDLVHTILTRGAAFLMRARASTVLRKIPRSNRRYRDGSYLAWLVGKVEDPSGPLPDGRKRWLKVTHVVRVIEYRIRGFRKARLITSLLDPQIPARDLVRHYHKRWEIELTYDAIKTHQCATRTGQSRTIFRSKLPVLVEQELYAMMALYNLLRDVINQAAERGGIEPLRISFVDALLAVIDAVPAMQRAPPERLRGLYEQLLDDIACCVLDRWRRKRAYPRVVKVKMSSYSLKRSKHKQSFRDFDAETKILGEVRLPG